MEKKKQNAIIALLGYAGNYKVLTFIGLTLSAISMLCSIVPYVCIWLVAKDLITAVSDFSKVQNVETYGWIAFGFAVLGIVLYFIGLISIPSSSLHSRITHSSFVSPSPTLPPGKT